MTYLPDEPVEVIDLVRQDFLIVRYLYTSAPLHGLNSIRSLSSEILAVLDCGLVLRRRRGVADLEWHRVRLDEWRKGLDIEGTPGFSQTLFGFGDESSGVEIWEDCLPFELMKIDL